MTMPPAPAAVNAFGTVGEPAVSGIGTAGVGATTPPVTVAPPTTAGVATLHTGNAQFDQLIDDASTQIDANAEQLRGLADRVKEASLQFSNAQQSGDTAQIAAAQRNYDALNASYVSALSALNRAYENRISVATRAIDARWMQPGQQSLWQAQAAKDNADVVHLQAETAAFNAAAPLQRAQLTQQIATELANSRLAEAQAGAIAIKTPAEVQQLQANANQAQATANLTNQQVALAQATMPADVKAKTASADALVAAAEKAIRENRQAPTDAQAVAANTANVTSIQAAAAKAVQDVQKGLLGPVYGLGDQIQAIRQITEGVKSGTIPWSGDPAHLDTLLNQYLTASVGGTTPAAAATTAAGAQATTFGQQLTQRQQDIGLAQSQLGTFGSLANQGLSTIAGMNPMAAIGSTEGARALGGYVQAMLGALKQPQFQAPPPIQAPSLPPFLQNFAAPQAPAGGSGQAPVVHINIGGGAPTSSGGAAPAPAPAAPTAPPPDFAAASINDPSRGMPAFLQGKMPATPNDVVSLYPGAAQRMGMA